MAQQVYCVKVVSTFLKSGVPLKFRELLQDNAFCLMDRHHMYDCIPFILKEEESSVHKEIAGKCFSNI